MILSETMIGGVGSKLLVLIEFDTLILHDTFQETHVPDPASFEAMYPE